MCWFHMRRAAENKLSILSDTSLTNKIMQDIDALHTAPSEELFNAAVQLFLEKWRLNSNSNMPNYLVYFENEWIKRHKGWFDSYIALGPSTNNGLESTNAVIKKRTHSEKDLI